MNAMDGEHCYFFTLEVEPMTVGKTYKAIPLHCTIMHRFFSSLPLSAIDTKVRSVFAQTKPLLLQPLERAALGPNRVLVAKLQLSPALKDLHLKLYGRLNELGVRYSETDWVATGYKPHVTEQAGRRLSLDTNRISDAVYLVEVEYPLQGKRKFIKNKFNLLA
jgi:2'-5' RNA ligase